MSVKVEYSSTLGEALWTVRFANQSVEFRHAQSAHEYAAKLKERIDAAHPYPGQSQPS
ncbi:MAG: hypothetical protein Q8R10_20605 [Pseudomonas sp.]|uniref:hypothetical protein n=1 Tax=Pseudomonas sp. TaxID=306 RepID=UPI002732C882|nr:hypothetical protein [Pseudomonas sp.]MDP3848823.1 hypothetical protein [Pseudomonas sp.]